MEKDGRIWYYIYDGHGSTRLLTNEEACVTDRYSYDACGNLLQKEGGTQNDFLYTGEQYNANTGLYYLRARYMDPSTGTFISMDSYPGNLNDPVSLHKYLYANANPVMNTDPSGYMSLPELSVGMTISEVFSTSWHFIALNTLRGALIGGACGAVDSVLGGGSFNEIVQGAFKGALSGALFGVVLSALACYAVIAPFLLTVMQVFQGVFLASGVIGVWVSGLEGHPAQALFRGILGIYAFVGTGKLLDGVKYCRTPPRTLYRGEYDNILPDTTFKNGFTPKGTHNDALLHTQSNETAGNFVSTSSEMGMATHFAEEGGYVYVIRTKNYIDINAVYGDDVFFPKEMECAVPGGIKSSEVTGAYQKQNGQLGAFIPNPYYKD